MSTPPTTPKVGSIWFILIERHGLQPFYLDIKIPHIKRFCFKPVKFLRYLAWCILGVEGPSDSSIVLSGVPVADDEDLIDQGVYKFSAPGRDLLEHAIDMGVFRRMQSPYGSGKKSRDSEFLEALRSRDVLCIFTGTPNSQALHIIPFAAGNEYLRWIIDNRPHDKTEKPQEIDSINHIRNGFLGTGYLNSYSDKSIAILKTPNCILSTKDVPEANRVVDNTDMEDLGYPTGKRFTLQWISGDHQHAERYAPNNSDAMFRHHSVNLPSTLLLAYHYGAMVVRCWGKGSEILSANDRTNLFHPQTPPPYPSVPQTVSNDHSVSITKLNAQVEQGSQGAAQTSGAAVI